jgi:hypothetical protein
MKLKTKQKNKNLNSAGNSFITYSPSPEWASSPYYPKVYYFPIVFFHISLYSL